MVKVDEAVLSFEKQNKNLINKLLANLHSVYQTNVKYSNDDRTLWTSVVTDDEYYNLYMSLGIDIDWEKPYTSTCNGITYILVPVKGSVMNNGILFGTNCTYRSINGYENELLSVLGLKLDPDSFRGVDMDSFLVKDFMRSVGLSELTTRPGDDIIKISRPYKKLLELRDRITQSYFDFTLHKDVCTGLKARDGVLPVAWIDTKGRLNYPYTGLYASAKRTTPSVRNVIDLDTFLGNSSICPRVIKDIIRYTPSQRWLKVKPDLPQHISLW